MSTLISTFKRWAKELKQETVALYLAYKNPRTPWYARLWAAAVVVYAFSPLDLIPDPIPIIGYLDDLILVPLGILIAIRLIPPAVLAEARAEAAQLVDQPRPGHWLMTGAIITIWIATSLLLATLAWQWWI